MISIATPPVVRPAVSRDVRAIQILLAHSAGTGELLPRSKADLEQNLAHFRVIDTHTATDSQANTSTSTSSLTPPSEAHVSACGSLEHFTAELAEIRSLMVAPHLKGGGLGQALVQNLIEVAKTREVKRVMALTYVPEFFHRLGFKTVKKEIFPEKVWGICVHCSKFEHCDEIAVLLEL